MKKIYHLKTCDTCKRILNQLPLDGIDLQEIKANPITAKQLDDLYAQTGSYEALFNKRAKLYKEMNLKDQSLNEKDYRHYILEHYTFLKRPVAYIGNEIFVGNSKKTVEDLKKKLEN